MFGGRWALRHIGAAVSQNASAVTGWRLVASALELLQHGGYCSVAAAAWRRLQRGCRAVLSTAATAAATAAAAAELRLQSCGCGAAAVELRLRLPGSARVHSLLLSTCTRARTVWLADVDGDGHINPKEIRTVMRDVGVKLTADEIKQLIASVDADGNGMVRKHARASDLPAISRQPHAASVT